MVFTAEDGEFAERKKKRSTNLHESARIGGFRIGVSVQKVCEHVSTWVSEPLFPDPRPLFAIPQLPSPIAAAARPGRKTGRFSSVSISSLEPPHLLGVLGDLVVIRRAVEQGNSWPRFLIPDP